MPKQQEPNDPTLVALLECNDLTGYIVTRYGYREECVVGGAVTDGPFQYGSGDKFDRLQRLLAAAAGDRADNFETYTVRTVATMDAGDTGTKLCLWFHDWRVTVGTATQPY